MFDRTIASSQRLKIHPPSQRQSPAVSKITAGKPASVTSALRMNLPGVGVIGDLLLGVMRKFPRNERGLRLHKRDKTPADRECVHGEFVQPMSMVVRVCCQTDGRFDGC